jgi:hypothetical protein
MEEVAIGAGVEWSGVRGMGEEEERESLETRGGVHCSLISRIHYRFLLVVSFLSLFFVLFFEKIFRALLSRDITNALRRACIADA